MSWNNAYERKKFNARIKREIAEYQAAGMTEEQIAEIVMFDEEQFRNDRRYRMHTQEFCESDFDDDEGGDNGKSPLYQKYMEQLTVSIDDEKVRTDRYGWIEDIKNTELYTALSNMSEERMDLLTSIVFEGKSMTEIAKEKGLSVSAITQRMGTIKKYLKKFSGQPYKTVIFASYHLKGQITPLRTLTTEYPFIRNITCVVCDERTSQAQEVRGDLPGEGAINTIP